MSKTTYGVKNYYFSSSKQLKVGNVVNVPKISECGYSASSLGEPCCSMENEPCWDETDGEMHWFNENVQNYYDSSDSGEIPENIIKNLIKLKDGSSLPENSDELIKLCEPSKYGDLKTQTTVLNEDVRKAYEIKGEDLILTDECLDFLGREKTNELRKRISEKLYAGRGIRFEINKLNVYTKGCHFKTHVDTPKDNMIGTLVIELPYEYEGGEFILEGKEQDTKKKWMSFYSNLPHKIQEIKSGCRVSITFYIMVDADLEMKPNMTFNYYKKNREIEYYGDMILEILEEDDVGLILSHTYSNTEWKYDMYRGPDAYLMEYLRNNCIVANIFPAIIDHYEQWGYQDHEIQTVHRFLESDMVVTAKQMSGQKKSKMMYDIKENSAIPFYHVGCETEETDEFEREQEYIDYTGNECQEGYGSGQYFTIVSVLSKKIKITDELADFIGHERGKEIPRHVINTKINQYLRDNGVDDKLKKLIGMDGKSSSKLNSYGATEDLKKLLRKHYLPLVSSVHLVTSQQETSE